MKRCFVRASRSFSSTTTRVSSLGYRRVVAVGGVACFGAMSAVSLNWVVAGETPSPASVSEPYTGQAFPSSHQGLPLAGVGVRVKYSYFSVYALALYGTFPTSDNNNNNNNNNDDDALLSSLRRHWSSTSPSSSLLLIFQRSVGGAEVGQALKDSLQPRVGPELATQFSTQLTPHALKQGTHLEMRFKKKSLPPKSKGGPVVQVSVVETYLDGSLLSSIESEKLADALLDVYLAKDTVSPSFRTNVLQNARKNKK